MPSFHSPAYYERALHTAGGRADHFLKWIDPDHYLEDTGSTEAPVGHVALVRIDRNLIAQYVSQEGDPWLSERRNFEDGWYIIRRDDNGLIWGMYYGELEYTLPEEYARADFYEAVKLYADWESGQHF